MYIAIGWCVGASVVGYVWARRLYDRDPTSQVSDLEQPWRRIGLRRGLESRLERNVAWEAGR